MGYVKGEKIYDKLSCSAFKTYVKFQPDLPPMVPYSLVPSMDGKKLQKVENRETSSTLYDHWKSNAIEKFLKGMTTKTGLPPIDQKKLMMLGAIALGALAGIYMLLR